MNLIFDWSGTLADDERLTFELTRDCVAHFGGGDLDWEAYRSEFTIPVDRFYGSRCPGTDIAEIDRWFFKSYEERLGEVALFDGVAQLLGEAVKEHRLFILSTLKTDLIAGALSRLGLADLFEEVVGVFRESGRSVPVFCDKHLSWSWENAQWMRGQASELGFALQAGSSVPLAWRLPPLALADGVALEDCLSVYYAPDLPDGVDYALYHTLEALQAFVEHRLGGETGVRAVHCLEGAAAWQAAEEGRWSPELLASAIDTVPSVKTDARDAEAMRTADPNPVVVLVEYTDEFRAAAYLTRALLHDEFCLAARVAGSARPVAPWFHLNKPQRDHFSFLCNHAEVLFRTGRNSTSLEPTMLVTGILEAAANSRHENHRRIETPHLRTFSYQPFAERRHDSGENDGDK